ncbi:MAG: hypothetical protein LBR19_00125 [Bifidobacteriaceae bacterium]|jgi:hypothetical protein|nr:hypothetical protein [Bifidobacteriaceae bacterium]
MGRYRLEASLTTDLPDCERFQATDRILGRKAELFVLWGDHTADAIDAARRAALVSDSRLVRIIDAGRYSGISFVLTEPLEGPTLSEVGPLPAAQARAIAGEVASALATAADADVHHLALRPELIHLPAGSAVKIGGMAWEAAHRGQATADPLEASRRDASDLVAILYAALTARWPGETPSDMPGPPVWDGHPVAPIELVSGVPGDLNTLCSVTLAAKGIGPSTPAQVIQDLGPWPAISVMAARVLSPRPGPADQDFAPAPHPVVDSSLEAPNRVRESQVLRELKARLDAVLPPGLAVPEPALEPEPEVTAGLGVIPPVAEPVLAEEPVESPLEDLAEAEEPPVVLPDLAEEFFGTGNVGLRRDARAREAAAAAEALAAEAAEVAGVTPDEALDPGATTEFVLEAEATPEPGPGAEPELVLPEPWAPAAEATAPLAGPPTDEVVARLAAQAEIQEKLAQIEALLGPLEADPSPQPPPTVPNQISPLAESAGRRSRALTDEARRQLLADLDAALNEPDPAVEALPPAAPLAVPADDTEVFQLALEGAGVVDLEDIEVPRAPYGELDEALALESAEGSDLESSATAGGTLAELPLPSLASLSSPAREESTIEAIKARAAEKAAALMAAAAAEKAALEPPPAAAEELTDDQPAGDTPWAGPSGATGSDEVDQASAPAAPGDDTGPDEVAPATTGPAADIQAAETTLLAPIADDDDLDQATADEAPDGAPTTLLEPVTEAPAAEDLPPAEDVPAAEPPAETSPAAAPTPPTTAPKTGWRAARAARKAEAQAAALAAKPDTTGQPEPAPAKTPTAPPEPEPDSVGQAASAALPEPAKPAKPDKPAKPTEQDATGQPEPASAAKPAKAEQPDTTPAATKPAATNEPTFFDTATTPFGKVLDGPDLATPTPPRKWRTFLVFALVFVAVVVIGLLALTRAGVIDLGGPALAPGPAAAYAASFTPFVL